MKVDRKVKSVKIGMIAKHSSKVINIKLFNLSDIFHSIIVIY